MSEIFKIEIPSDPSDKEVAGALSRLPRWRLEKALSFKRQIDRFLCAEAYLLLKDALHEVYGLNWDFTFKYGINGKPVLAGIPGIHFNLSHCRRCVCCAVSDSPVGIDVEDIQFDIDLAKAVLNDDELGRVLSSARPEIEFTRFWTMKESLLKLTGEGIRDDLKSVLSNSGAIFSSEVNTERGYAISVAEHCGEEQAQKP